MEVGRITQLTTDDNKRLQSALINSSQLVGEMVPVAVLGQLRAEIERLTAENEMFKCALQDIAIGLGERVLSQEGMRARAFHALNQRTEP